MIFFTLYVARQGDEWYKVRRILNMKLLKPNIIGEYSGRLNRVVTDVLSRFKETRHDNNIVPNIKNELLKWSLECESINIECHHHLLAQSCFGLFKLCHY